MPQANRNDRLSPGDLARQVARRLADTGVQGRRLSLRDSVLLGRVVAGITTVVVASALVLVAVVGLNWVAERSSATTPTTVAFAGPTRNDQDGGTPISTAVEIGAPVASTTTTLGGPFLPTPPSPGRGLPALPAPTTTSTIGTTVSTTSTTAATPTTATSSPTTSTSSTTSTTAATTTSTAPTTTTTAPTTTTTTTPTTTTTTSTTTTTTTVPTTTTTVTP